MMTAAPEDSSVGQDGFAAFVDVRGIVVLPDVDGVVLVAPEHALICVGYIILFAVIVFIIITLITDAIAIIVKL